MANTVDYYIATSSPWTYLATPRIKALAEKYNLIISWKPFNIMEVFAKNGTALVKDRPKPVQINRLNELKRWRKHLNIPLTLEPKYFPVDITMSQKIIICCQNNNIDPYDIAFSFMKSVWVDEKDISNENTIKELCRDYHIDSDSIIKQAFKSTINDQYIKNTEDAIKNNVWGAPTFILDKELFWGQDRLDFLERKIQSLNL